LPLPDDHLRPIWRGMINGNGVGSIALDPREAEWCLKHGATLDGVRYRVSLKGWYGTPDKDGRVSVRLEVEA
jgi:hypothetical protein